MYLWIDDVRPTPTTGWTWARTYDEAIKALEENKDDLRAVSLDHDMAEIHYETFHKGSLDYDEQTGYEIALFMKENDIWPYQVFVHSANPVGRKRIREVIEDTNLYVHINPINCKLGPYRYIDGYVRKEKDA